MDNVWYKRRCVRVAAIAIVIVMIIAVSAIAVVQNFRSGDRSSAVQNYIALQEDLFAEYYPEGSISYTDAGDFIELKCIQKGSGAASVISGSPGHVAEDQLALDMLAYQDKCPVLLLNYLEDGFLYSMQIGFPEDHKQASESFSDSMLGDRLSEASKEADEFAADKRDEILKARCEEILLQVNSQNGESGYTNAEYTIEPETIWINVTEAPGFSFREFMSDDEYSAAVDAWRNAAETDTRFLRKSVGYRFFTDDGEVDLEVVSPMVDYYTNPHLKSDE